MIVATAGHIDHGKTSLVRALTGVDTDRLPEEKRRGLTIDLGFAYPKGNQSIGFVDVPGHERFVRNMIAGVTAIDCAIIVIAADDGPMPQTSEHLAILDLLGVKRAAVALTKIDKVAPERIDVASDEISSLLEDTALANAPVFPLSTLNGDGVGALKAWLDEEARTTQARERGAGFRMAVDRSFVIDGAGVVVTGAVASGSVEPEQRLVLSPEGIEVRVRGIHAHNRKAQQGSAGERCAINVAAPRLSLDQVYRGQWLVAPEIAKTTMRFDARIRLLPSETRALRHWTPVHLHIGAADVPARVALLEGAPLEPGGAALGQLVLSSPVSALFGDRFVLRDQSGRRTIGGGIVIDPFAPSRGRAKAERIAMLRALEPAKIAEALANGLNVSPSGFELGAFLCAWNVSSDEAKELVARHDLRTVGDGFGKLAFTQAAWNSARIGLGRAIAQSRSPNEGLTKDAVARATKPRVPGPALEALLADLIARGEIEFAGGMYRPRGATIQLEPQDAALWAKLQPLLDNIRPPTIAELAAELKADARPIERLLQKVARMNLTVQIAPNRYYLPDRLRELASFAEMVAQETPGGLVSIRAFRDKSGVGRNLSVEALEFFDRLGFTGRAGEHRRIVKPRDQVRWARGMQ